MRQEYAVIQKKLSEDVFILSYSAKGKELFDLCHARYDLVREIEPRYTSEVQIARSIRDVLTLWREGRCQAYDRIVLLGLGLLIEGKDGLRTSVFADHLYELVEGPVK